MKIFAFESEIGAFDAIEAPRQNRGIQYQALVGDEVKLEWDYEEEVEVKEIGFC